jgi:hypothetical protein
VAHILSVAPAEMDSLWRDWIRIRNEHRTSRNRP